MTITSQVIGTYMLANRDAVDVPLSNGLRVQVLPSIEDLPRARKHQFAAFVAAEGLLVVWDDDPNHMLTRGKEIEEALMDLLWDRKPQGGQDGEPDEKKVAVPQVTEYEVDEEGQVITQRRSINLQNSVLVGFTIVLVALMIGAGIRSVATEIAVDKGYLRAAFLLLIPIQIFFTLVSKPPFPFIFTPDSEGLLLDLPNSYAANVAYLWSALSIGLPYDVEFPICIIAILTAE